MIGNKVHDNLQQLYNEYKRMIYGIIKRYEVDKDDTEDLAQDVIVKIINNIDKLTDVHSLKTKNYICAMTKNRVIDYFNEKSRKDGNVIHIEDMVTEVPDKRTIEAEILQKLTEEQRKQCIDSLKLEYKIVIYMRYVKNLSEQEISQMLGITIENVRVRLHRATKQLRKMLDELNGGEV